MSTRNDFDEFGDSSFLMEVDLDAITASSSNKNEPTANHHSKENQSPDAKRRKISSYMNVTKPSKPLISTNQADLEKTLSKYFGYSTFRDGQLAVIQSALSGRDTTVFWATGSGKSICFQLPALHTNKITLVVSPLISLMADQVQKLNGLTKGNDLATFLGSGQSDKRMEGEALQGKYLLVYITPEKLLSNGFLDRLSTLHKTQKEIGWVAIDEAHCVSAYGHDFRKEYRQIGAALREHIDLYQIPIIALTATAVPKVQEDICYSLRLNNPMISKHTFDRPNLIISVHKKDRTSAIPAAMEPLLQSLTTTSSPQSTIVYAPTRSQGEDITSFLHQRLLQVGKDDVFVECYHAGMSIPARSEVHTNFLTGRTQVVVATVAFGMGIDKPDTRRVIHFGPPKTVEDYYQQIGRAGRDGIQAEATMYVSESDFDRYKSDFYLGELHGHAKDAVLASIDALKSFSLDASTCRRKALLDFFQEVPSFGKRCGTCDCCRRLQDYSENDLERDFGPIARVVLQAVDSLNEQSASVIMNLISGKEVDSYRCKRSITPSAAKDSVSSRKNEVKQRVSLELYREFLVPLVQRGFLSEATKTAQVDGYSRSWTGYLVTPKGKKALYDRSIPITLPVPESVLAAERKEKARREKVLSQLKETGVAIEKLPQEEVEAGDGHIIRALSKYQSYLESMRRNGKEDRAAQLEELKASVEKWRADTAISMRIAPANVLAEHTLLTLTYTAATLPSHLTMGEEDLLAAGVRNRGIESLCKVLADWAEKYRQKAGKDSSPVEENSGKPMRLTQGKIVKGGPWKFAVYKVVKKTGLATWESSYNRFMDGESPQSIAMTPLSGRPIQAKTVCGHIMQALLQGRGVDLHRLQAYLPTPNSNEWEQLHVAETSQGLDVCEDDKVKKSDLIRPILGETFMDIPFDQRSEDDKAKLSAWYDKVDWYMAMRRIGYQPEFA